MCPFTRASFWVPGSKLKVTAGHVLEVCLGRGGVLALDGVNFGQSLTASLRILAIGLGAPRFVLSDSVLYESTLKLTYHLVT